MVKAAVLAMNATNDILHEETCGKTQLSEGYPCREEGIEVDRWALTGGSKRGWTAWLAAGVDYKYRIQSNLSSNLSDI